MAQMIRDQFSERYGSLQSRSRNMSLFAVHPSDIAMLLGKNGSTINKIARDFGITIDFVPYTETYPNTPPHFRLQGIVPAMRNAQSKMADICRESLRRQWKKSEKVSEVTNTLTIEREDMKMVIGKKGHTIQGINKKYDVRTFTRPDEQNPKHVSTLDITGYGPNVCEAKKHIWNIIQESKTRRGVNKSIEQQEEEMFTILKKQEDDAMVEKMVQLYKTDSTGEFSKYHLMLQKSDPVLLKRVDEVCRPNKESKNKEKRITFSDEEQ